MGSPHLGQLRLNPKYFSNARLLKRSGRRTSGGSFADVAGGGNTFVSLDVEADRTSLFGETIVLRRESLGPSPFKEGKELEAGV